MEHGLTVAVEWTDESSLGVRITAANEDFTGSVFVYSWDEQLADAARIVAGFPTGLGDTREVEFGTTLEEYANGCVRLAFRCTSSAGRSLVEAYLQPQPDVLLERGSATIVFQIDGAGVDDFVREFARLMSSREGTARLRGW